MIQTLAFKFRPKKDLFVLDQTLLPERKVFIPLKSMLIKIQNPKN